MDGVRELAEWAPKFPCLNGLRKRGPRKALRLSVGPYREPFDTPRHTMSMRSLSSRQNGSNGLVPRMLQDPGMPLGEFRWGNPLERIIGNPAISPPRAVRSVPPLETSGLPVIRQQ
jgi:hypothetical protein